MGEEPFSIEVPSLDEIASMHPGQPREQPLISENIHEQLKHMELSSWSISVQRRLRDAISRISPKNVLELGGQIGHRTSWLFDLIERGQWSPERYIIVEEGPKFGVILKRLIQRYQHNDFTSVVIQNPIKYIENSVYGIKLMSSTMRLKNNSFCRKLIVFLSIPILNNMWKS